MNYVFLSCRLEAVFKWRHEMVTMLTRAGVNISKGNIYNSTETRHDTFNDSTRLSFDETVVDPADRISCLSRLIRLREKGPNQEVGEQIY